MVALLSDAGGRREHGCLGNTFPCTHYYEQVRLASHRVDRVNSVQCSNDSHNMEQKRRGILPDEQHEKDFYLEKTHLKGTQSSSLDPPPPLLPSNHV